jgi:hypothetical protein
MFDVFTQINLFLKSVFKFLSFKTKNEELDEETVSLETYEFMDYNNLDNIERI